MVALRRRSRLPLTARPGHGTIASAIMKYTLRKLNTARDTKAFKIKGRGENRHLFRKIWPRPASAKHPPITRLKHCLQPPGRYCQLYPLHYGSGRVCFGILHMQAQNTEGARICLMTLNLQQGIYTCTGEGKCGNT